MSCQRFDARGKIPPNSPFFADKVDGTSHSALQLRVFSEAYAYKTILEIRKFVESQNNFVHAIIDTGASVLALNIEDAGNAFCIPDVQLTNAIERKQDLALKDGTKLNYRRFDSAAGPAYTLHTHTVVAYLNTCTKLLNLICCRDTKRVYRVPTIITKGKYSCAGYPILRLFNMDVLGWKKETTMLVPFSFVYEKETEHGAPRR
ncbi:MAG: hypothetical protein NTZ09_07290 [Candidatus Hydrogenedentes bacterium]|nr:hypothetical protein [Candidatus Hydrogenedentota bacterium]